MRGGSHATQLGLVTKAGALLGRALSTISDLAWNTFFRFLAATQPPPLTPEQQHQQRIREREAAITHYLETHRREES